jgi:hypothetical protein
VAIIKDISGHFKLKTAPQVQRESGIHLSNIIWLMAKDGLKNWEEYRRLPSDAQAIVQRIYKAGFVWEELLSLVFKERWGMRPQPFEKDGIWMSPDGVFTSAQLRTFGIDSDASVLLEMKWTRRSTETPIDTWWTAIHQVKSYCVGLGMNEAIIHACHYQGNYKWCKFTHDESGVAFDKPINLPPVMDTRTHYLRFTDQELSEWWAQVLAFADINFDTLIKMEQQNEPD